MIQNPPKYLFDTCVIIAYWRKKGPSSKAWVDNALDEHIDAGISIITDSELWSGVMDKRSERDHKILLAKFRRYQFNLTVARRTGELLRWKRENKNKSDGVSLQDLIIAATAEYYRTSIVTDNTRDFRIIPVKSVEVIDLSRGFTP